MDERITLLAFPVRLDTTGPLRLATPADLAAHLRTLPHAEQVAALVALLRECPDAAVEALCCPACGQVLALRVQRAEHDGFGHITAPRNVWLECPDGCAGVPRVG